MCESRAPVCCQAYSACSGDWIRSKTGARVWFPGQAHGFGSPAEERCENRHSKPAPVQTLAAKGHTHTGKKKFCTNTRLVMSYTSTASQPRNADGHDPNRKPSGSLECNKSPRPLLCGTAGDVKRLKTLYVPSVFV